MVGIGAQAALVPAVAEGDDLVFAHPGQSAERLRQLGFRSADFRADPAGRAHAGGQSLRRVGGRDASLVDDEDAAAGHFHLGENVGGKQDGVPLAQVFDQLPHLADLVRIEADGRLVEDEQIRIMQERVGQTHALAVAFGQGADQLLLHVAQAAQFLHRIGPLAFGPSADAFQGRPVFEVFLHAHLGIKGHVFRHVADTRAHLAGLAGHVEPGHAGPSAGGRKVTGQDPHGRALARAVGPEKTDDFPFLDREIEILDGRDAGVFLGQSFNLDHDTGPAPAFGAGLKEAFMARFGGAGKRARSPGSKQKKSTPRCVSGLHGRRRWVILGIR